MLYGEARKCQLSTHKIHMFGLQLHVPAAPLAKEITVNPVVAWSASFMYKSATTALFVFSWKKEEVHES